MQGIVLTSCADLNATLNAIRGAHLPLLKVVTGWGYPWDDASRMEVCTTMPEVLVRTVSGDGTLGPPSLAPDAVLAELRPWYDARPDIAIELGNEPNADDASDNAAWNFRYWFLETVSAMRSAFPLASIVSPGLIAERQTEWWAICQDAFALADAIGVHAYAHVDFDDTGQLDLAREGLAMFYPDKPWALTECGINDPATAPEVKCQRYAALASTLPQRAIAACWYAYNDHPLDADQAAYAIPASALPYLAAGEAI